MDNEMSVALQRIARLEESHENLKDRVKSGHKFRDWLIALIIGAVFSLVWADVIGGLVP